MRDYLTFLSRCVALSFVGGRVYYAWMFLLTVLALVGLNAYARQLAHGLAVTGMTDQVSWGLYIGNFIYLDGLAAAVVLLVIPAYIYRNRALRDVVIFGQLFAVAAVIMCMLFVAVDLGRPDRFLHLFARPNFPDSMLTWDVIALGGYLLLNIHLTGYLVFCQYRKREPDLRRFVIPFVLVVIVWAITIQAVAAFLLSGLGGRPFWNSAVVAPRFLASAFAAGPAFMILTLECIARGTGYRVPREGLMTLRGIMTVALALHMFLLGSELFTAFYTGSAHAGSARYLFLGLDGHTGLVPWIWTAIALNLCALGVLFTPASQNLAMLSGACVMLIVGVWIEKGMGLIVPAFVPTPLGEIVEYAPTLDEVLVTLGVWGLGLLLYTILVRVTVPVLTGRLTIDTPGRGARRAAGAPAPRRPGASQSAEEEIRP
ncbi:MAG: polysulfide reductase NrfD [Phycisphaerales bacterium]|nr:polysulfide reductase NrfD [Phycisphaerales bacterium]